MYNTVATGPRERDLARLEKKESTVKPKIVGLSTHFFFSPGKQIRVVPLKQRRIFGEIFGRLPNIR